MQRCGAAGLCALGQVRAWGEVQCWRNCGIKELWCSSSHHQAPMAVHAQLKGWVFLSPVTWQQQPSQPLLWQPWKGEQGVGRGIQTGKLSLISSFNLCTRAGGGGQWLDAAHLEQDKHEEQHGMAQNSLGSPSQRLVLLKQALLSFSPPLGFMALELQGWKIIHPNRSSHNTLCKHLWLQTPLQQWVGGHKFIIVTSLASCQAGHEARSRSCATDTLCACHSHSALTGQNLLASLCHKSLSCAFLEVRSSHHSCWRSFALAADVCRFTWLLGTPCQMC